MKPSVPKGTRDFLPSQVAKRKYIFGVIEQVFQKYGYVAIETPTMENLSTLTGKYGEEGDKLLFKVLNNGDYLKKADAEALAEKNSSKLTSSISKRGLRYDLTVPFARYVVMHQNDLYFPFKRYQIQPVWRADRPQKGRYNEFYQCDADVVGSDSLLYEAELVQIFNEAYGLLNVDAQVKVNNRKILFGLAEVIGATDKFMDITIAIDKLDKIGWEGVKKDLQGRDLNEEQLTRVGEILAVKTIEELEPLMQTSATALAGIQEIKTVQEFLEGKDFADFSFDITLARGLNYYTGCILEVAPPKEVQIGSIGGGGRYDDLTGVFGLKDVSGVGISFGFARIYDVMEELNLFPETLVQDVQVLVTYMDSAYQKFAFDCVSRLRKKGVRADVYPSAAKFQKQMKYANKRGITQVIIIGQEEFDSKVLSIKNLESGDQKKLGLDEIIQDLLFI